MAIPCGINTLNQQKFFDNGNGDPTVRVGGTGTIIEGIIYDALRRTNTSSTVDTFEYFTGGLSGTLLATVTVTYTDDTKCDVSTVERS